MVARSRIFSRLHRYRRGRQGWRRLAVALREAGRPFGHYLSFNTRKRRALLITLTDDNDIAAAAMIGDSNSPVNG
jgi:hypothetical protein